MRATVLRDPAFVKAAGRFVWLEVDTEKPVNAPFLERFPVEVWPTFFVVDPEDEKTVLKWLGGATATELRRLLSDAERALEPVGGSGLAALLARADRANGAGDAPSAIELWRKALERGGPDWERRPRVLESLATALQASLQARACAELATRQAPAMARTESFANVVSVGLDCALSAEVEPWAGKAIAALEPLAAEAVRLPGVLADSRASLYEGLFRARQAAKDREGEARLAEEWWSFLVAERRRAGNAPARTMLDSWIVEAASALGDPGRALPILRASEAADPRDYNPPFRLAKVYLELRRYDEALAASNRAAGLAYGPAKLRALRQRATVLEAQGNRAEALRAVDEAIAYGESLPAVQRDRLLFQRLEAQRATLARP